MLLVYAEVPEDAEEAIDEEVEDEESEEQDQMEEVETSAKLVNGDYSKEDVRMMSPTLPLSPCCRPSLPR